MITLFGTIPVYIKMYVNRVEVMDLRSGESLTKATNDGEFSNDRLVVANFQVAEALVRLVLKDLLKLRSFLQPSLRVVIQQMEKLEGGLSQIEIRVLRDLAEVAGASHVAVIEIARPLSQQEALSELNK